MACNVVLSAVTLLTLPCTKLRYRSYPKASGARGRQDGSPQDRDADASAEALFTTAVPAGARKNHCFRAFETAQVQLSWVYLNLR